MNELLDAMHANRIEMWHWAMWRTDGALALSSNLRERLHPDGFRRRIAWRTKTPIWYWGEYGGLTR